MSNDDRKLHPVNARMKNLRLRLGYPKPGKFAQMLGISIARWCNVETGHPFTHAVAVILKHKIPGLTYDYIYDGEVNTLGDEIRLVLGEKPSKKSLPGRRLGRISINPPTTTTTAIGPPAQPGARPRVEWRILPDQE